MSTRSRVSTQILRLELVSRSSGRLCGVRPSATTSSVVKRDRPRRRGGRSERPERITITPWGHRLLAVPGDSDTAVHWEPRTNRPTVRTCTRLPAPSPARPGRHAGRAPCPAGRRQDRPNGQLAALPPRASDPGAAVCGVIRPAGDHVRGSWGRRVELPRQTWSRTCRRQLRIRRLPRPRVGRWRSRLRSPRVRPGTCSTSPPQADQVSVVGCHCGAGELGSQASSFDGRTVSARTLARRAIPG